MRAGLRSSVAAPSKVQDMGRSSAGWRRGAPTGGWSRSTGASTRSRPASACGLGCGAKSGIGTRIVRDDSLIPWAVKPEHRHSHSVSMLRAEARRRAGKSLTPLMEDMLNSWLLGLRRDGTVVHYDLAEGWRYVPPREGIDKTSSVFLSGRRAEVTGWHPPLRCLRSGRTAMSA